MVVISVAVAVVVHRCRSGATGSTTGGHGFTEKRTSCCCFLVRFGVWVARIGGGMHWSVVGRGGSWGGGVLRWSGGCGRGLQFFDVVEGVEGEVVGRSAAC